MAAFAEFEIQNRLKRPSGSDSEVFVDSRAKNGRGDATALNLFIGVLTKENTGRESEAPAELFRPRDRPQVLVDAKWPPNKAPQERRSPVMMDRIMKRCLELWGDAPAEP